MQVGIIDMYDDAYPLWDGTDYTDNVKESMKYELPTPKQIFETGLGQTVNIGTPLYAIKKETP